METDRAGLLHHEGPARAHCDIETLEQLLMGLADQQFFLSLELTKFAVKVAVSLRRD